MARKHKFADRPEFAEGAQAMKEGKNVAENPYAFDDSVESPKKAEVNIPHLAWAAGYKTANKEATPAEEAAPVKRTLRGRRIMIRYNFSDTERLAFAEEMNHAQQDIDRADNQRKAAAAQFKAQADFARATREKAALAFTSGYEMREIQCDCIADDPAPGLKTFYRTDTGEKVKTEEMDAEDKQPELPLGDEPGVSTGEEKPAEEQAPAEEQPANEEAAEGEEEGEAGED